MALTREIQFRHFKWVDIHSTSLKTLEYLQKKYKFLKMDLQACPPPLQNPRIHIRDNYIFTVLLFPVLDKKTMRIMPREIDFFITKDTIITIHEHPIPPVKDLFQSLSNKKNAKRLAKYNEYLLEKFFFKLINKCYIYCFPLLTQMNHYSSELEMDIFSSQSANVNQTELIKNILYTKRDILNFRKSMHSHKNVWQRLLNNKGNIFVHTAMLDNYIQVLIEHTRDLWEVEETYRESINALYDTHTSITSIRLNDVLKTLTAYSLIFFPLTIIASIYGMNVPLPVFDHIVDFWIVMGIMVLISSVMIWIFKKIRWV